MKYLVYLTLLLVMLDNRQLVCCLEYYDDYADKRENRSDAAIADYEYASIEYVSDHTESESKDGLSFGNEQSVDTTSTLPTDDALNPNDSMVNNTNISTSGKKTGSTTIFNAPFQGFNPQFAGNNGSTRGSKKSIDEFWSAPLNSSIPNTSLVPNNKANRTLTDVGGGPEALATFFGRETNEKENKEDADLISSLRVKYLQV